MKRAGSVFDKADNLIQIVPLHALQLINVTVHRELKSLRYRAESYHPITFSCYQ